MLKLSVSALLLALSLALPSKSAAQGRIYACAWDQFSLEERDAVAKQIVAAIVSQTPESSALKKQIGDKIDHCPNRGNITDRQWGVIYDYTEANLILDGMNADLPKPGGRRLTDVFWDQLPTNLQKALVLNALQDDGPAFSAGAQEIAKSLQPYRISFAQANRLTDVQMRSLNASLISKAQLLGIEANWEKVH